MVHTDRLFFRKVNNPIFIRIAALLTSNYIQAQEKRLVTTVIPSWQEGRVEAKRGGRLSENAAEPKDKKDITNINFVSFATKLRSDLRYATMPLFC